MNSQPVDYAALAAQNGAVMSSSAPAQSEQEGAPQTNATPDYNAIAAQNGDLNSMGSTGAIAGQETNDVGNTVIVPKEGETFSDTMKRAAAQGKKTTPEQINKEVATMPEKAAETLSAAASPMLPQAITSLGSAAAGTISEHLPAITDAANTIGTWAKANPVTALGVMWAVNKGLNAIGLPKASRLVEEMELPMLLLLGKGPAAEAAEAESGAAAAESETAAGETENAAPEETTTTPTSETTPPQESATDFVKRQTAGGTYADKPNGAGKMVDASGEEVDPEGSSTLTKEQQQAATDKYYAEHPEKVPQPKIIQRGANKGQVKTYKAFYKGKWVEVPVYK